MQFGFGRKQVVMNSKQRQVGADHVHHVGYRFLAEQGEPILLWRRGILRSIKLRQTGADRDQIVAGIKSFGDLASRLSQGLTIAQMHRAREDIDLTARVVDIIFADDLIPGKFEQ
jgi:hypothetical protein